MSLDSHLRNVVILGLISSTVLMAQNSANPPASQAPTTPSQPAAVPAAGTAAPCLPPQDWPNFARYHDANAATPPPAADEQRVVFMGDSITDAWKLADSFPGKPYINRGISGQTTSQMVLRFRPDVIDLHPRAVIILAGINDIAENTGPISLEAIEGNFTSMVDLAQGNNIRVVLSSILPAASFPWRPAINPVDKVTALNAWLKDFAAKRGLIYLDYFSALDDGNRGLKTVYQHDAVHPNLAGYAAMTPLAQQAITQALGQPMPVVKPRY